MAMRALASALLTVIFGAWAGSALQAQTAAPAFKTASVKRNMATPGPGVLMAVRPQNDRLTLVDIPGRQLIQMAFRVDIEQIEGAPAWLTDEHFDVTAKAFAPFSPSNQWQEMLRTLLEERFKLRARREPKEAAGFVVVMARSDTPQNFLGQSFDRERFPTIDPAGPALGTAFEEQLGLKLQPRRVPRDTIVIEHIERPSPN